MTFLNTAMAAKMVKYKVCVVNNLNKGSTLWIYIHTAHKHSRMAGLAHCQTGYRSLSKAACQLVTFSSESWQKYTDYNALFCYVYGNMCVYSAAV